jgi:transcriptional regulator with XRE-family HTH domain
VNRSETSVAYPATVVADLDTRMRELGEFIRDRRQIGHLSLRKLSERAGISNPYLSQIERGLRKPSAEILQQIARALEISSETLYIQAGILDPRDDQTDLASEIRRDPHLSEDQKKTLIRIYESFRHESSSRPAHEELTASR